MKDTPTVACSLTEGEMSERRRRWHELAGRAFVARTTTDRGLRLEFRQEPGIEDELGALALLERDCCPFASWDVTTTDGRVVLEVGGTSDEGVAAVQEMFRDLAR